MLLLMLELLTPDTYIAPLSGVFGLYASGFNIEMLVECHVVAWSVSGAGVFVGRAAS